MVQIIPSILATSEEQYQNNLFKLAASSSFKEGWVHIDFADNKFVQNKTIDPEIVGKFPTNFRKEAHLMVSHPKEWIEKLVKAGFERIIFHIESEEDPNKLIDNIRKMGLGVGIAIKMDTDILKLEPFANKIDLIVVMSIIPGFQGQPFIIQSLDRIREMKDNNWPVKIEVDGSVNDKNIKAIIEAGADLLVVGSFLLKGDTEENLEKLWVEMSK